MDLMPRWPYKGHATCDLTEMLRHDWIDPDMAVVTSWSPL
jgi:hypothetical protein